MKKMMLTLAVFSFLGLGACSHFHHHDCQMKEGCKEGCTDKENCKGACMNKDGKSDEKDKGTCPDCKK